MGKTIFAELDEITFNRIKTTKNMSGMIDEKKFFSKKFRLKIKNNR